MATPLETAAALKQTIERLEGQNHALNTILNQVALATAFEEPEQLILPEGVRVATENPKVVVSITVNGKGIKTETTFPKADVEEQGWTNILAQGCMAPLGILARELTK